MMSETNDTLQVIERKTPQDLSSQMDSILRVAELLEKGVRNTGQLMKELNVSRPTAIRYRNEALKVIHQENKQMNTEAMRGMEIGRLNYWIDWLQVKVNSLTEDEKDREYKVKLLGKLDAFQGRLHSITGLNTTVNVNYEEKKRITFVMNSADKRTSTPTSEPIEGEVVENKPTT